MTKQISADTSFLLVASGAETGNKDVHEQARWLLNIPSEYHCIVPIHVCFEFVEALEAQDWDRPGIVRRVKDILNQPAVEYAKPLIDASLDDYLADPGLSFAECLIGQQAKAASALPILTCDTKLAQRQPEAELFTADWA
jgi:predicted nucleic-acid-binding protein